MNNFNWRMLLAIGAVSAVVALVVIVVSAAFSAMWAHGAPNGSYGNGPYGPGTMMGPMMWGGMGFFWIFPFIGFLLIVIVLGLIGSLLFGNAGRLQSPGTPRTLEACKNCRRALETDWIACPYCRAARSQGRQVDVQRSSDEGNYTI